MKLEYAALLCAVALGGVGGLASVGGASRGAIAGDARGAPFPTATRSMAVSRQAGTGEAARLAEYATEVTRWADAFPGRGHAVWDEWTRAVRDGIANDGHAVIDAQAFFPTDVGRLIYEMTPFGDYPPGYIDPSGFAAGRARMATSGSEAHGRAWAAVQRVSRKLNDLVADSFGKPVLDENVQLRVQRANLEGVVRGGTPRDAHVDDNAITVTGTFLGKGTELSSGFVTPRGKLLLIPGTHFERLARAGFLPGYEHVRAALHREPHIPKGSPRVILLSRPQELAVPYAEAIVKLRAVEQAAARAAKRR